MKKKYYILFILLMVSGMGFAQYETLKNAINFYTSGNLDKAKLAIDQASLHAETANDARTWFYKGVIYKDIYKSKESTDLFSYSRNTSADAYENCILLDNTKEFTNDSQKALRYLISTFYNDASKGVNEKNYKAALFNYDNYIARQSRMSSEPVELEVLFYAGYAAYFEKQAGKSKQYLEKAQTAGYSHPYLYFFLSKIYLAEGNDVKSQANLEKGYQKFPQDKNLASALISYYQQKEKTIELEQILIKELVQQENTDYRLLLGIIYQKWLEEKAAQRKEFSEKAKNAYLKVLQRDPENLKANYNMGLVYYNEAVFIINGLDYDMDMVALEDIQEECKEIFKKALPYMEKAYNLNPKNKEVLTGLSGIYFSLRDDEKSAKIKAELEKLDKN